ncbi:MAG: hypothetical protein AB8G15_20870 [Saprospiraceae bacterium]
MSHFKFLFLDSDPQINFLTSQIIEVNDLPIEASFQESPLLALEYLAQCQAEYFPDVILVSSTLRFMTGLEFVDRYIQQLSLIYPNTRIYITSSYCSPLAIHSIELSPKVEGFIPQPFSKKVFLEKIVPNIGLLV